MPENVLQNVRLSSHTTLGVGGVADYFTEVTTVHALKNVCAWARENHLSITILGGGSNVLIPDEGVRGLVVHPQFSDIEYIEKGIATYVTVGAGVNFDNLVQGLVSKNLWGLENLSGIPGSVGAVPIQNVGAYGVEVKDVIDSVLVFNSEDATQKVITHEMCAFTYRDSFFKTEEAKKYIILSVTFRVSQTPNPKLTYKDLQEFFKDSGEVRLEEIREAVLSIRSKKFPDWNIIGTAGSFFKNPIIPNADYVRLLETYPGLPGYPTDDNQTKVSLGWILDRICSMKGYIVGSVGLFEKQALVLVCEKGTSSKMILDFSEKIIDIVFEKTKIKIEHEVSLLQ